MGIFGMIGDIIGGAANMTKLMSRADAVVLQLTGNHPKHLHPTLYRHLLENVKALDDEAKSAGDPLNEYEAALIMLSLLCAGTRQAENPNPAHRADVYESAINHLRVQHTQSIRPTVSLYAFSISG
jgi:hypothetical protein